MRVTGRRRAQRAIPTSIAEPRATTERDVVVATDLAPLLAELEDGLGESFRLTVGEPESRADAVIVTASVAAIERTRSSVPSVAILAIATASVDCGSQAALDAGADRYIPLCAGVELAARVRACLRRQTWNATVRN